MNSEEVFAEFKRREEESKGKAAAEELDEIFEGIERRIGVKRKSLRSFALAVSTVTSTWKRTGHVERLAAFRDYFLAKAIQEDEVLESLFKDYGR